MFVAEQHVLGFATHACGQARAQYVAAYVAQLTTQDVQRRHMTPLEPLWLYHQF